MTWSLRMKTEHCKNPSIHRGPAWAWLMGGTLLWSGCVTTTTQFIHRAPDFDNGRIHHVLVIGVFKNQELRKDLEAEFVRQWKGRGVQAVSSLEVLPASTPLTQAEVTPIAQARGFD